MADVEYDERREKLFSKMLKTYYKIPDMWNAFVELDKSESSVNTEKYEKCVLKAKKAILQVANEKGIEINQAEFLKLTFQTLLPTKQSSIEKDPSAKTQMNLYEIRETAIHICDRFKELLLDPEQKKLLLDPEEDATDFFGYSLRGVVITAIMQVMRNYTKHKVNININKQICDFFVCNDGYLNDGGVGVCVLLLYVIISEFPDKGAEYAAL
jgi:hypothetical protein